MLPLNIPTSFIERQLVPQDILETQIAVSPENQVVFANPNKAEYPTKFGYINDEAGRPAASVIEVYDPREDILIIVKSYPNAHRNDLFESHAKAGEVILRNPKDNSLYYGGRTDGSELDTNASVAYVNNAIGGLYEQFPDFPRWKILLMLRAFSLDELTAAINCTINPLEKKLHSENSVKSRKPRVNVRRNV